MDDQHDSQRIAVVYNPSKPARWDLVQSHVNTAARLAGLAEPFWLATTVDDPGSGQTKQAIQAGASLVIAAGGDGTVRIVAGALAGTGVPMGILPLGTANLFASNLRISNGTLDEIIAVALAGHTTACDVAWMHLNHPTPQSPSRAPQTQGAEPFLIIGGAGFDAETMASVTARSKELLGKFAYFRAGLPHLLARKLTATIEAPNLSKPVTANVRAVMFANCPEINDGITIDPSASPRDGILNINILDVRGGLLGWADLTRRILQSRLGLRSQTKGMPVKRGVGGIRTHPLRECHVSFTHPHKVQVDGDVIGYTRELHVSVSPAALLVRVPEGA